MFNRTNVAGFVQETKVVPVVRTDEPYFAEDGVLVERGESLFGTSRIAHALLNEDRHFPKPELNTGPDPEGYVRPDTSVTVRYTNQRRTA